jgi:hypothetical protein
MAYAAWSRPRAAMAAACLAAASIAMQPARKFLGPPGPVVVAEADGYGGRSNPFWTVSGRDSVTPAADGGRAAGGRRRARAARVG